MSEVVGNRAVEDAATAYVVAFEQAAGRHPHNFRGLAPPAISTARRAIEVNAYGTSARGTDLWLEPHQVQEAPINPDFYVYVVENIRQGDPAQFTVKGPRRRTTRPPLTPCKRTALLQRALASRRLRPRLTRHRMPPNVHPCGVTVL